MQAQTILLVQTDILIRHPLAEYLRSCGYNVIEAGGPDEARKLADAGKKFEIALLDALEADGFELAQWFRKKDRSIEVIVTGTVKKTVQDAMELCDQGPKPDHTSRHKDILREIQVRLSETHRKEA